MNKEGDGWMMQTCSDGAMNKERFVDVGFKFNAGQGDKLRK